MNKSTLTPWPAPCFIGSGCPKRDFSESGCPFMEGYIFYNMIKQDAVGVWTPRTPPVAPALKSEYYLYGDFCGGRILLPG